MKKFLFFFAALLFAGSMMADEYTLKFNGTGDASSDGSDPLNADVAVIFTKESQAYVASVEKAEYVYAGRTIAEDNSCLKFGTSSKKGTLAFKLKEPVEVDSIVVNATQYGKNVAEVTINGTKIEVNAGNKKPQNCKATPSGKVETITVAQTGDERIYVRSITIYPKAIVPAEMKTIYCKMEYNWWTKDGAAIAAYAWKEGGEANAELFPGERMTAVEGQSGLWKIELDVAKFTQVIFTRVNASGELQNWGAQTEDLTIPTDDKDLFTITNTTETWAGLEQKCTGEWSKYDASVTPPVDPDDAKFYITGSANLVGADNAWNPAAIKVETDVYVFENLAAGDYKMKVTLKGDWDHGVLGYDELTVKPEGVTPDKDRNICFTLAEPSNVTVTYTDAAFTVEGNFYVKPDDPPVDPGDKVAIRLVPGVWNKDGAKFACLTTNEGTAATVDIASLAAKAVISDWFVGGDTVVGLIPADTKVIAFGRLNPATQDLSIMSILAMDGEGHFINLWNHSDILDLDPSLIYTIDDWGTGDYSPGHWGEGSVDPETKEISLVPGSWASDNAIFAAWAWPQGKEGTWSVFQGSGETLRANISAAADSILFVRFVEGVTTPEWETKLIAYKTADLKIEDCGLFYFEDQTWCAPATPDENDFYITGDEALVGQDKEWNPAAIPVKGTSYTFTNLPAGSYKLKVTENGKWTTAKGYGDLTTVTENLSKDKADNICFTLGEAGDVVVTYTATVFTVEGKFVTPPEPQKVEIRLVPGVWNLDGAKFAAITFTEMPADMNAEALANAVISDWFVGGDTVVGLIPEDARVIGFGRFNPETTELTLMNVMAEGTMWNHSDIMYIDESMIYTITGWPEEGKDVCPGYWGNTPPQPAEDEWFLVGDMTDWQNGKISFANGPISATLKDEGRTYGMKILKINGDKETWYSNNGIMERSNCSGWEFTVDVQDNSGLIVDQAGVYTFSMSVNEFGNPVVTVQYPVGEGLEDIDASVKAVKVVHNGQVLILRGEHIFTVMGQQVK